MPESPFRKTRAVNFRLPGEERLLHFFADWLESELTQAFRLVIVTPGNGTPNLVQAVPRGPSLSEEDVQLGMIRQSLHEGLIRDWNVYVEILPLSE